MLHGLEEPLLATEININNVLNYYMGTDRASGGKILNPLMQIEPLIQAMCTCLDARCQHIHMHIIANTVNTVAATIPYCR